MFLNCYSQGIDSSSLDNFIQGKFYLYSNYTNMQISYIDKSSNLNYCNPSNNFFSLGGGIELSGLKHSQMFLLDLKIFFNSYRNKNGSKTKLSGGQIFFLNFKYPLLRTPTFHIDTGPCFGVTWMTVKYRRSIPDVNKAMFKLTSFTSKIEFAVDYYFFRNINYLSNGKFISLRPGLLLNLDISQKGEPHTKIGFPSYYIQFLYGFSAWGP